MRLSHEQLTELFDQHKNGDRKASRVLLTVARKLAFRILAARGITGDEATDVGTDCAIIGLDKWEPARGALGSAVTWAVHSALRHQHRRAALENRVRDRLARPLASECRRVSARETVRTVAEAIRRIPRKLQKTAEAVVQGSKIGEIAREQGRSVMRVQSDWKQAKAMLQLDPWLRDLAEVK